MNEYLYRGKRKDNGEWVVGYFVKTTDGGCFITSALTRTDDENLDSDIWEVIPETVGEFTGYNDIKGIKIFQDDIIKRSADTERPVFGVVKFGKYKDPNLDETALGFYVEFEHPVAGLIQVTIFEADDPLLEKVEIVGNIYDNPELLEAAK